MKIDLTDFNTNEFEQQLVEWFHAHKRDLPWREDMDPYKIWVSEIMLQQTKVDTVIPYFNHFISEFPTLEALAYAEEERVLKAWEGLGYYSRARNLQAAVREVVADYDAKVPDTKEEISKLKGVGPYTSGAILSIAYQKKEPAVDGNVMRVMSRVLLVEDDIGKVSTRKAFEEALKCIMTESDPSGFNQGLMELGALVCKPKSPGCLLCPVRNHCRAYEVGMENQLPIKKGKTKVKHKEMAAVIVNDNMGNILIHKRDDTGLLAKLWEIPNHETNDLDKQIDELIEYMSNSFGISISIEDKVQTVEHTFSHLVWNISVYNGYLKSGETNDVRLRWVNNKTIETYPFPVSHQKIIEHHLNSI